MTLTLPTASDYPTVVHGDCIEQMRLLPDGSIDAVVTDPPYGLNFMGKAWDGAAIHNAAKQAPKDHTQTSERSGSMNAGRYDLTRNEAFGAWCKEWMTECLRVLKPGGHLLAFGGSRTWHRLACAAEDAGFEIRDSMAWLYGSGFPKSMNVAKAIDSGGGRPEDIRRMDMGEDYTPSGRGRTNYDHGSASAMNSAKVTSERSDAAKKWEGWGTALKPAYEPIVVARKPLGGTVAANVLEHGTGALNIDACRIPTADVLTGSGTPPLQHGGDNARPFHAAAEPRGVNQHEAGRWPANIILDEHAAALVDKQSGDSTSRAGQPRTGTSGDGWGLTATGAEYDDHGGASRFFYIAKAPQHERPKVNGVAHPTVKPIDLMRWLIRLVTPPGGIVLEPFAGSGTTVEACILEDVRCIAIERETEYLPLIQARIDRNNLSLFGGPLAPSAPGMDLLQAPDA